MSPNIDDHGPGLLPALFLAALTFFIGMVLGTTSMISKEVRTINRNTNIEDLDPGTVYHIKGDRLRAIGWETKEQALMSGLTGTLTLSESELNQWSTRKLRIESPAGTASEDSWTDKLDIKADPLDFRVIDDQVLVATELTMPGLLGNRSFLYQVRGDLVAEEGVVRFKPVEGSLGYAPLGQIPGVRDLLFESVISLYASTEPGTWLPEVMPQIGSVQIADGQLVLGRN